MIDDSKYGTRNKRDHYTPNEPLTVAPLYTFPPKVMEILRWIPGFLWPWNLFLLGVTAVIWLFLTPDMETMKTLAPGWIAWILLRNAGMVMILFGAFHLRLYIRRKQGGLFKYNPRFPETKGQKGFLFGSQVRENLFWTFASGVPIWSAYEVGMLHAYANGWLPTISFESNPWGFVGLIVAILFWRELHFYLVHRLIHWGPFYRWIHKLHHNNVNPGPWSSLSMHPVEHILYFSVCLPHLFIPSSPFHPLFSLHHAGLGAIVGHIGFDKVVVGQETAMDTHAYAHYLHHKFFEVNYSDGTVPLDRFFGTFHDGTPAGDAQMEARRRMRTQS